MFRTMSQTNNCNSCRVQKPLILLYVIRPIMYVLKKNTRYNVNNIIIYYHGLSFILEYNIVYNNNNMNSIQLNMCLTSFGANQFYAKVNKEVILRN